MRLEPRPVKIEITRKNVDNGNECKTHQASDNVEKRESDSNQTDQWRNKDSAHSTANEMNIYSLTCQERIASTIPPVKEDQQGNDNELDAIENHNGLLLPIGC